MMPAALMIGEPPMSGAATIEPIAGAPPVEQMCAWLDVLAGDEDAYLALWERCLLTTGCQHELRILRGGSECFRLWCPVEPGDRDRVGVAAVLVGHLRDAGFRQALIDKLRREYRYLDDRASSSADLKRIVRAFLATGSLILIDPEDRLTESAAVPRAFAFGTDEEAAACLDAGSAYFHLLRRHRARPRVKRIARTLGRRSANGWIVLEARS